MNAPATARTVKPVTNQVLIAGRIESMTKYKDSVVSLVRTPAEDEYSYPSTIEIRSKARLGQVGDDISVTVKLNGVPRAYTRTDKETGEQVQQKTADMYLHVIE